MRKKLYNRAFRMRWAVNTLDHTMTVLAQILEKLSTPDAGQANFYHLGTYSTQIVSRVTYVGLGGYADTFEGGMA